MVRKPTSKPKNEDEVEVKSPKTPVTPEFIDDTVPSPTFTSVEQEDTTIWSSSFSWNMQTTSEFNDSAMNNVWEEDNKHGQLDITKNGDNKDDFEENVWTDVQMVAGMPNNQSIFSVPFVVPDSPTFLKPQIENVSTISMNDPSHQERIEEENDISKDSIEINNSENFDYVDLGKDNFPSSKELLSKEFDEFTNTDVNLELNNNEIFNENTDSLEQCENENSDNIVVNEEEEEDDDFGAFECSEENESSFDDFGEFKSENTNDFDSYQGIEKSSSDIDDDFGNFENSEKSGNSPNVNIVAPKELDMDLMSVTNSVAEWIAVLDKIYDLQILNESNNDERPVSIEDLVYNSHAMLNTSLNWSSFIKLWSDQGGVIKFSWRSSQIQKAFLESINSISAIKTADRLPGSDLFKDDRSSPSSNYPTHDDEKKQHKKNSTEALFINTNNTPIEDVPKESIKNNDNKQSSDLNRDSWITMSDISLLESFSSKSSSKSNIKKSQRKSESFLDDFLDIKTSPTSPVSNSRIDSVIAKISRNSTNLSAKLGSLKSHVFGTNDTLIPIKEIKENPSSPNVKHSITNSNLLDDLINDTMISKKTNEKKNSNGLHITPVKSKNTSKFSTEFGDIVSASPSDDLNQQKNFKDQMLPKSASSVNNNTISSKMNTKLNDNDLLNSGKTLDDTEKNSSLFSEFDEMISANKDNDSNNIGNQKQPDNWISPTDLSFLESFTSNSKPSSSNSRKSQQNIIFDVSEFDLNPSLNIPQPQKTLDNFFQSISQSSDKGNTIPTLTKANDVSKIIQEKPPPKNTFNSNPKQLYVPSMNISSTSISDEFGEMVSANDTENQNIQDDWMLNTSTNQDNWMSNSGLSFLETLKTSSNNNYYNNNNRKSKQLFGDLDEFILPLSSNNNNNKNK
ncbi:hypothetical protein C1645_732076 [Glomus cerebriforme]|uniref:Uncharacterized protein n=1 Tax=Glomus cerebriforme TaxID=658196 RepID=A0A397TI83_9GLOM|nr:hypothetical protein C1645_732076 [Glomus cerebriforme]